MRGMPTQKNKSQKISCCKTDCFESYEFSLPGIILYVFHFSISINIKFLQVDLIDLQSQADGDYKFIMVYQDHLTKFVRLRALKTKTAAEVAYHLTDIFSDIGAPIILQSDNGREFANSVRIHLVLCN